MKVTGGGCWEVRRTPSIILDVIADSETRWESDKRSGYRCRREFRSIGLKGGSSVVIPNDEIEFAGGL